MSIVIDENILAIWYVCLAEDFDVMFALMRDGEGGYKGNGRTRAYNSKEDPWDEKDRKLWFGGPIAAPDDDSAVAKTREHMVKISAEFPFVLQAGFVPQLFEMVRGLTSLDKFAETLRAMPWAHS